MNNFFIIIAFSLFLSQTPDNKQIFNIIKNNQTKINEEDAKIEKQFSQAKQFERAGLYNEALLLYKEINLKKPGVKKYFQTLKNHLKQLESWDSLLVYADIFSSARKNDELAKLELLEIYIWLDNQPKWEPIVNEIIKIHSSQNSIKKVIQKLVNNGKHDFAYHKLKVYRKNNNLNDFYSFEMGMFFTMRMAFDKGLDEYLLYLSNRPKQYQNISNRIMAFPNTEEINRTTINTLKNSDLQTAQYILADLKFKLKEYNSGYEILRANNAPQEVLMNYAEDLFLVKEYIMAEQILKSIVKSESNDEIITKAIFEIAKIFEAKMVLTSTDLPISGFYTQNSFFTAPYTPLKENASLTLTYAMDLYDSLHVTKKNAQAAYRLANIQFKILGDLDGAYRLYQAAKNQANTNSLLVDSGLGMLNVKIAKGDLKAAEQTYHILKKQSPSVIDYDIKYAEILFYKADFDAVDNKLKEIIDILPLEDPNYNDILDVMSVLIGFRHNQSEFKTFCEIQLDLKMNNRVEAMEKLKTLYNTSEIFISDMCKYQHAWLNFIQNNLDESLIDIATINNDTIFKEMAHIFKAEIYDYSIKDISKAISSYLEFLELYPNSIYYDEIRLRLRDLAS